MAPMKLHNARSKTGGGGGGGGAAAAAAGAAGGGGGGSSSSSSPIRCSGPGDSGLRILLFSASGFKHRVVSADSE